eukprot:TRINITY_DN50374_c0_g1_i1.p1 TRINITY_DN50374_c0_g1~~TRINITY_DN50374_c0_g1_i1.p1  ORF type:complete len:1022 (+),score=365.77 TRINITY_DN50374_c0_g1_i1:80-3067(+)
MSTAQYRSVYRVDAKVRTLYTGSALAVPPNGGHLFTAAAESVLMLDYGTGRVLATGDTGDGETVSVLACSADGATLFAASRSLQCRLWAVADAGTEHPSLRLIRQWLPSKQPTVIAQFSPDGGTVALGASDGAVRLWDHAASAMTHNLAHDGGVITALAFLPGDLPLLAVATFSGQVALWGLEGKNRVATLHDHAGVCQALGFFYDGAMLVTAGKDTKVNVYQLSIRGGKKGVTVTQSHSFTVLEEVWCMARVTRDLLGASYEAVIDEPQADKEAICIGGEKGQLRYFYLERSGRARKCKKELPPSGAAPHARSSGDGGELAVIDSLWPVAQSGELVATTRDSDILFYSTVLEQRRMMVGNVDHVTDVRYGVGDQIAAASNSADLRIFHSETPQCDLLRGHKDIVVCLAASKCRRWLASGSKDRTIRIWDAQLLICTALLSGHTADVTGVAFGTPAEGSSTPLRLASVSADLTIRMWDLRDVVGAKRRQKALNRQAASKGGGEGDAGTVVHLESSPVNTQPRAHESDIHAVEWNPTAELLATCSKDKLVKVWEPHGGCVQVRTVLKGHRRRVHALAFSPVEKAIASAGGDHVIKLWSLADGTCLKTFQGHTAPVLSVRFINSGLQLLSGSSDGDIKVWGIKHQTLLATLAGHGESSVWSLDVAEGDRAFLSGGHDGVVNVWRDFTDEDREEERVRLAIRTQERQLMENVMRNGEYERAVELGLRLQRPQNLRSCVRQIITQQGLDGASSTLQGIVSGLPNELLDRLFTYGRDWAMNALFADVAACVLRAVLGCIHTDHLAQSDTAQAVLEPLLSYTTRHYERLRGLQQQLHLLSFFAGGDDALYNVGVLPAAAGRPARAAGAAGAAEGEEAQDPDAAQQPRKRPRTDSSLPAEIYEEHRGWKDDPFKDGQGPRWQSGKGYSGSKGGKGGKKGKGKGKGGKNDFKQRRGQLLRKFTAKQRKKPEGKKAERRPASQEPAAEGAAEAARKRRPKKIKD